ncbi:MAG: hypothetical protein EAZ97_02380 [Bacteroidetes bacterium]|nr:MAG: hypothetical protein EAZ97_02380 [Bacteroidota bacterium]
MIWIDKNLNNEPEEFKLWKKNKLSENWFNEKKPSEWWQEINKETKVKKALQSALLEEQGHICCYCCRKITNDQAIIELQNKDEQNRILQISVEHYQEKVNPNYMKKMFDYDNLLASCKSSSYCNEFRGKQKIQDLTLNPTKLESMDQIEVLYEFDKSKDKKNLVKLTSKNELIQHDLDHVLNLNNIDLAQKRKILVVKIQNDYAEKIKLYANFARDISENEYMDFTKQELEEKYLQKKHEGNTKKYPSSFPFVAKMVLENLFE